MPNPKTIFLIAGEASGDSRGAELVQALEKENPTLAFEGLGGPKMQAAGVKLLYDLTSLAALGFGDVLRQYFQIRKIFYEALHHVQSLKPAAIVFIDYPGFNLRFAKKIQKKFPVFYYVSPQVWAWGGRRINTIRHVVDHMIVLFQFEESLYKSAGIPVTWVGHPLVETCRASKSKSELKQEFGIPDNKRTIALLPGSRESEVKRILPVILESARLIQNQIKNVCFLLSETSHVSKNLYNLILQPLQGKVEMKQVADRMRDLLEISDSAIVTSGTATLETALAQIPFTILYKTAWSTYEIGKRVIRIPYIGMVNVIAGRKIVQEFIQNDADPKKIASEILRIMNDTSYYSQMTSQLKTVKEKLGPPGASTRAAKAIIAALSDS